MVTMINSFDEAPELPYSAAVDHQNESHSDRVLHFGQAVVQVTNSLDLIGDTWPKKTETWRTFSDMSHLVGKKYPFNGNREQFCKTCSL